MGAHVLMRDFEQCDELLDGFCTVRSPVWDYVEVVQHCASSGGERLLESPDGPVLVDDPDPARGRAAHLVDVRDGQQQRFLRFTMTL